MNFEKLPVVSTGEMLLDLSGNGREPIAVCPVLSLRGIDDFQERNLIEAVEYVWQVFLSNVTD